MIYLTNQEENMIKVLIFTNQYSWRGISDNIRDRVEWDDYPNERKPYMECASGIYLVYDKINPKLIFNDFADDCFYYVLIHTCGVKKEVFVPWKNKCYILQGKHENNQKDLYYTAFDIITDSEANKQIRIINSIFVKNALMVFVDECNAPGSDLDKSYAYCAICQLEVFKKDLELFKQKYKASKKLIDYREDLQCLKEKIAIAVKQASSTIPS